MKEKSIPNIILQKLLKGNKEKSMKNYRKVIFYQFPVLAQNTHMQLSKPESGQESRHLQSSTAE